jgi:hypothetical protein
MVPRLKDKKVLISEMNKSSLGTFPQPKTKNSTKIGVNLHYFLFLHLSSVIQNESEIF